jgi:hypothetical protein
MDGCPRFALAYLGRKRPAEGRQPLSAKGYLQVPSGPDDKRETGSLSAACPTQAQKRGLTPISCHAVLERSACAPFIKERRMEGINATSLRRKSGQMGHPTFVAGAGSRAAHSTAWIFQCFLQCLPVLTQTPEAIIAVIRGSDASACGIGLYRLRNSCFVSGHDFSRAEND